MTYYGVGTRDGSDVLLVTAGPDVLAFETRQDAEDYIDVMDEPGEWFPVPIDELNGEHFVVIV